MHKIYTARLLLTVLWIGTASAEWTSAEERFVENRNLSGQAKIVNAARSWHVTDAGLKQLRSFVRRGEIDHYVHNKVVVLKLDGTQITDAGLKHFEGKDGLIALEELSLADTEISDAGLNSLAGLKRLRRVNLGRTLVFQCGVSGPRVTAAGVQQLRMTLPDCRVEHQRVELELSDRQRVLFKLWSMVAEPRLNKRGDIIALVVRKDAQLKLAHRKSFPQLKHLAELHTAGMFKAEDVALLPALASLRQLCLRGCLLPDGAFGPLEKLTALQVLDLGHTPLSDQGLSRVQSLTKLTAIDMRSTGVRTRGLQSLRKSLPDTEFVFDAWRVVELPYHNLTVNEQFGLSRVGSVGYGDSHTSLVQKLTQLLAHPTLEQTYLRHTKLTNNDLKIIARMSNLKELDIGNTKITAVGVRHLAKLEKLENLNLWMTKITGNGGLSALEKLPRLKSLELDETDIDDGALLLLARIKSLRYVELWHTNVTRAGIARLQKMRPDIEIKSNPRK